MKKIILVIIAALFSLVAISQSNIYVYKTDGFVDSYPITNVDSITFTAPQLSETYLVNGVYFKMIKVKGGTFNMGAQGSSPTGLNYDPIVSGSYMIESPVHSVILSDYTIGETEVTQALWYAVMGTSISLDGKQWDLANGLGDNYPAYNLSYDDIIAFVTKLNLLTGKSFRLPTEAQWEFAARGGIKSKGFKYAGSDNLNDVAWFGNYVGGTVANPANHQVKTKLANELGIYDMLGNVQEWCSDWFSNYTSTTQTNPTGPVSGSERILRGGSWLSADDACRFSYREWRSTYNTGFWHDGFRLAQ